MLAWSRYPGFIAFNGALASAACCFLWQQLPPPASEPGSPHFWPITAISFITFALFYPVPHFYRDPFHVGIWLVNTALAPIQFGEPGAVPEC